MTREQRIRRVMAYLRRSHQAFLAGVSTPDVLAGERVWQRIERKTSAVCGQPVDGKPSARENKRTQPRHLGKGPGLLTHPSSQTRLEGCTNYGDTAPCR